MLNEKVLSLTQKKHEEPHRVYHTWNDHIKPMLAKFDKIRHEFHYPDAAYLAILFHDSVYEVDAQYKNNEILSAAWMSQILSAEMPEFASSEEGKKTIRLAIYFIRATEKHDANRNAATLPKEVIADIGKFLDLDLGILSSTSKEELLWYESAIRKEFSIYNDEEYQKGRDAVLHKFLERKSIFFSKNCLKCDQQGRANLAYLIQRLHTK